MKNTNITLPDAFRIAATISGRKLETLTLGDVSTTFSTLAKVIDSAISSTDNAAANNSTASVRRAPSKKKASSASTPVPQADADAATDAPAAGGEQKRGRGRPKKNTEAAPATKTEQGDAKRAPRGQRRLLIETIVGEAGGELPFASVAAEVVKREGISGDSTASVRNAVYAILNKMAKEGDAKITSEDPMTIRIGGGKAAAKVEESDDVEISFDEDEDDDA